MKKIFIGTTFFVQIAIVLSFIIPTAFNYLNQLIQHYEYVAVAALVFLVSTQLTISMHLREEKQESYFREMTKILQGITHMDYFSEEEFYNRFLYLLQKEAKISVDITYLDINPPATSKWLYKKEYYSKLTPFIKKTNIKFRRILRGTKDNLQWIDTLIKDLSGHENFSLACLMDPDVTSPTLPAISLQRIDDEHTFIVAMAEQEATTKERDIYVKSKKFTEYAVKYYERLWDKSLVIIHRGKVRQETLNEVKQELIKTSNY